MSDGHFIYYSIGDIGGKLARMQKTYVFERILAVHMLILLFMQMSFYIVM